MPFVVEENEPSDPADVCFLGADGIMFQADLISDMVKQSWWVVLHFSS